MAFLAFCALSVLVIPTSQQLAVLVGVNYAMKLSGSPEGQKILALVRKKANQLLDEQLAEPEKKK